MVLPTLLEKLAAYVPTPIARRVYYNPTLANEPMARRFPAVVLFTDISGFTHLSELLSRAGSAGVEELSSLINRYFTQIIETTQDYQGQVVKFSGDALTVLFPATPSMDIAIRRAGDCALMMQSKMVNFSEIRTSLNTKARLSMKVGIGAGEILACSIGGALGRWEYLVAGDPLAQVDKAEHAARPGEIVFSPEAWTLATPFFEGTPVPQQTGFFKLTQSPTPIEALPSPPLMWQTLSAEKQALAEKTLQRFVPGAAKVRLNEKVEWLAELRRMTILFINVKGINYDDDQTLNRFQHFISAVQEVLYQFEGSLNKVAVDDKGTILLLLFGAPPVSHEDDPTRAVACSLRLQQVAVEQNLQIFTGITEGQVFAGPVGAPNRREYTVIGDKVNLAARLMQHAVRHNLSIVVSKRVKELTDPHFIMQDLGEIRVKGKSHKLSAYAVQGEAQAQDEFVARHIANSEPLIGRNEELTIIQHVVEKVRQGQLQMLMIEGELGVGKSRISTQLVKEWAVDNRAAYGSKCVSYGRQIPYQAWREVLTAIYGLTSDMPPSEQIARLTEHIKHLPEAAGQPDYWLNRTPLLAETLNIDIPENSFTRNISGELRRNNTFALIEAILRQQANQAPLLIVLEDMQWADELSLALIEYLATTLTDMPILLTLVHRPLLEKPWKKLPELREFPYVNHLRLDPLSTTHSAELLGLLLNGISLRLETVTMLLERAQGNPFFLQQIAKAVLDAVSEQAASNGFEPLHLPDLPDTIQNVILSRIDRLADETTKFTLKVAAVIGIQFSRTLLLSVHPMSLHLRELTVQLNRLQSEKLIHLERPAPKWEYSFSSVVTQEVVYEGLLLSQRRTLHATVGKVLEETTPDEIDQLAYHYGHSDLIDKGIHYLTLAAQKAQREYANQAAIDYYSDILDLFTVPDAATGRPRGIISKEYWDFLMARAKLHNLVGEREQEIEDLGTLGIVGEAINDDYRRALGAKQWAYLYGTAGNYLEGIKQIKRCVELAEKVGEQKLVGEGYNYWGQLSYLLHEYETAYQYLQKALMIAQSTQNIQAQADCLDSLGMVAHYQTDYEVALYFFDETTNLYQTLDDKVHLANTLNRRGQVYYNMGDYSQALSIFQEALTLHLTIGDRTGEAYTRQNLGRTYRALGDYAQAQQYQEKALTLHQAVTDQPGEAFSLYNLSLLHIRLQQYDKASIYADEALAILREIDYDPWPLGDALAYYGWLLYEQGQYSEAENQLVDALQIERALQQEAAVIEIKAHLGRVALAQQDFDMAKAYADEILAYLDSNAPRGIEHAGLVYLTLYQILQAHQQLDKATAICEQAKQYLQQQLATINDPTLQETYRTIPEHQAILQLLLSVADDGDDARPSPLSLSIETLV